MYYWIILVVLSCFVALVYYTYAYYLVLVILSCFKVRSFIGTLLLIVQPQNVLAKLVDFDSGYRGKS